METRRERGEGKLGLVVGLVVISALGWAAWHIVPVFIDHYDFKDKVTQICRTPRHQAPTSEKVVELLMKEVRERRLDDWITPNSFEVTATDTSRRIRVYYEREVDVLPGFKHNFKLDFTADQPLV